MPTQRAGGDSAPGGPETPLRVRARTVSCGIGLAAVLLLGMALIGGVGDPPARPDRAAPERLGPLTAVQPQLGRALLTGDEVARTTAPVSPGGRAAPPARAPEPPAGPPDPERTGLSELCRALLEDPAGLPGLWGAHPPQEVTTRQTRRRGGAMLHQTLGVFDTGYAPEAYGRLRETATGCDRLPVTLSDGTPVRVLLRELATGPPPPGLRTESARAPAERGYAAVVTVESRRGTRTGWLALDRVGPVISVLHQVGPVAGPVTGPVTGAAADLAETRRAALGKLRPLLEVLPG